MVEWLSFFMVQLSVHPILSSTLCTDEKCVSGIAACIREALAEGATSGSVKKAPTPSQTKCSKRLLIWTYRWLGEQRSQKPPAAAAASKMSLYRFVKSSSSSMSDSRHSNGGAGGGAGAGNSGNSSSRRLFVQGTREGDDKDNIRDLVPNDVQDLQALHTRRHLSSDVFDSSEEAHKKFRSAGTKYITTRVLRKTTTVTRGEEKSVSESLLKTGETNMLEHADEQRSSANRSYHHSSSRKRAKVTLGQLVFKFVWYEGRKW